MDRGLIEVVRLRILCPHHSGAHARHTGPPKAHDPPPQDVETTASRGTGGGQDAAEECACVAGEPRPLMGDIRYPLGTSASSTADCVLHIFIPLAQSPHFPGILPGSNQ